MTPIPILITINSDIKIVISSIGISKSMLLRIADDIFDHLTEVIGININCKLSFNIIKCSNVKIVGKRIIPDRSTRFQIFKKLIKVKLMGFFKLILICYSL